jgi:hypothetical protein
MINGISDYGIPNICNGVSDLIAQYIVRFKNGVGDLYVYPTGEMEDYCDYNYSVVFDDMHTYICPVKDLVTIEVGNWENRHSLKVRYRNFENMKKRKIK